MLRKTCFHSLLPVAMPFLLAPVSHAQTGVSQTMSNVSAGEAGEQRQSGRLEEVVVTASRRSESSQDYAGGLNVVTGDELERSAKDGYESYLLTIPNVSLRSQNGTSHVAVRGVSNVTGGDFGAATTTETVGLYLNDVPIGGTSVFPDLGLYDVQRVEVLKGPQGTLYGEGALGGAVRIILNEPQLGEVGGTADVTNSETKHGGTNYRLRGALNVPLGESVAMRFTATYREDDGYIDNVASGKKDTNGLESHSIRAMLKANLTEQLVADLLVMNEVSHLNQPNDADNIDSLLVNAPENRFSDFDTRVAALTLSYDMGFADLTSVSSYVESARERLSHAMTASFLAGLYGVPVTQNNFQFQGELESRAQEIRLVSKDEGKLGWIAGAFYRKKTHHASGGVDLAPADLLALNQVLAGLGQPMFATPQIYETVGVTDEFEQYALYGNLTYDVLDNFDVLVGLRAYRESLTSFQFQRGVGVFDLPPLQAGPLTIEPTDSGVVPKVGFRYRPTEGLMLFGTASQGFRSSAANIAFARDGVGEPGADSDEATTFEIGIKSQLADNRVNLNASIYHTRWKNMQLTQVGVGTLPLTLGQPVPFLGNGGDARINGAELQATAAIGGNFVVGGAAGYSDGKLTSAPATSFVDAELPSNPEWTASAFGEYRTPIPSGREVYVQISGQYVGEQLSTLPTTAFPDGLPLEGFFLGELRLGIDLGPCVVETFVENLTDERARLGRGIVGGGGGRPTDLNRFSINRPRTIGARLEMKF